MDLEILGLILLAGCTVLGAGTIIYIAVAAGTHRGTRRNTRRARRERETAMVSIDQMSTSDIAAILLARRAVGGASTGRHRMLKVSA